MPCRCDDYEDASQYIKEADKVTRMLCEVLTLYDTYEYKSFTLPEEVNKWWEKHKELDAKRKSEERIKIARERAVKMEQYLQLKKELGL